MLRHQTGTQYFAVEKTRDRTAVCRVLAPAPHLEPTGCLSSVTSEEFLYSMLLDGDET